MSSVPRVLEGARKALDNANKFTSSVTGGKPSAFAPKTNYSHARSQRKSAGSFMGVQADQGPELKAADQSHAEAEKALHPTY